MEHCNDLNSENIVLLSNKIVNGSKQIVPDYERRHKFHLLMFATPSLPTKDESRYLMSLAMDEKQEEDQEQVVTSAERQEEAKLEDATSSSSSSMDVSDESCAIDTTKTTEVSKNPYERSHFFANIAFLQADYDELASTRRSLAVEFLEANITNVKHVYDHSFWIPSNQFVPIANDTLRYSSTHYTSTEFSVISERIMLRYFERLLMIQKQYDEKVRFYGKSKGSNLQFASVHGCLDKLLKLDSMPNQEEAPFLYPVPLDEPVNIDDEFSEFIGRTLPDKYFKPKPHLPIRLPSSAHGPYVVTIYVPNLMSVQENSVHTNCRAERLLMEHVNDSWKIDPSIYESADEIDRDSIDFVGLLNVLGVFEDLHEASSFAKDMRDRYSNLFDVQVAQFSGKTFRYPRLSALLSSMDQSSIETAVTVPHAANADQ